MKIVSFILVSCLLTMSSCDAQGNKNTSGRLSHHPGRDSVNKPDIRFKVNKKYDEKGNIVSYDSTYSYSYSGGVNPEILSEKMLRPFNSYFNDSSSWFFNTPMQDLLLNDSTIRDSFREDYFKKQMEMNRKFINEFFQHFNSIQVPEIQKSQARSPSAKHT